MPMIGFLAPVSCVNQLSAIVRIPSHGDPVTARSLQLHPGFSQSGVSKRLERDVNLILKTTVCVPRSGVPAGP